MSNPVKEARENPVLRKLKEGSEKIGLTAAFQNVKQKVGQVTYPFKVAYSRTSTVGTTFMQRIIGNIQAIMQNPAIDILIGVGIILLVGYILKQIFYSMQPGPKTQFLSQTIYAWFVILSILYIVSKIL